MPLDTYVVWTWLSSHEVLGIQQENFKTKPLYVSWGSVAGYGGQLGLWMRPLGVSGLADHESTGSRLIQN